MSLLLPSIFQELIIEALKIKSPSNFLHYGYDLVTQEEQSEAVKAIGLETSMQTSYERLGQTFLEKRGGNKTLPNDLKALIDLGKNCWDGVVEKCLARSGPRIVVPISGGLDSRLILASLLEHLSSKEISTYTFGSKGTLDFEIGNKVAKIANTNHLSYDLKKMDPRLSILEENSRYSVCSSDLFTAPPLNRIKSDFPSTSNFWVGYMGDPSVGSHSVEVLDNDRSWIDYLFNKECYTGDLSFAKFIAGKDADHPALAKEPDLAAGEKAELWDLENRQKNYVLSQVFRGPFNFEAPFLDQEWLNFAFALPRHYRFDTKFYHQFLIARHPRLFRLPVKQNLGLPLTMSLINKSQLLIRKALLKSRVGKWKSKFINYREYEIPLRKDFEDQGDMWELLMHLSKRSGINEDAVKKTLNDFVSEKISSPRLTLLISLELGFRDLSINIGK